MSYVDGFLIPVPAAKREAYLAMATKASAAFLKNGATRVVECWGDDVPDGKLADFKRSVKAETDEVVVFSWIEWPSKEARNTGMAEVMKDPVMQPSAMADMPFDGKRMIFGGFAPLLDEKA